MGRVFTGLTCSWFASICAEPSEYDVPILTAEGSLQKTSSNSKIRFGFNSPVLIGRDGEIIAGHGRVMTAKLLGLETLPTLPLDHLSPVGRKTYILADNKLALNAGWDSEILAIEFQALIDLDFDLTTTGFELAEIDLIQVIWSPSCQCDRSRVRATTKMLGQHLLICGDARSSVDVARLLGNAKADMIFTDPPITSRLMVICAAQGRSSARAYLCLW